MSKRTTLTVIFATILAMPPMSTEAGGMDMLYKSIDSKGKSNSGINYLLDRIGRKNKDNDILKSGVINAV